MSNETKKFYNSVFWQENGSEGQQLWSMRKLLAFIMEISNPDTPAPFLTIQMKTEHAQDANNWNGWFAAWNDGGDDSLVVEWEEDVFTVHSLYLAENGKLEFRFYYEFGSDSKNSSSWNKLDDAVKSAKEWLLANKDMLLTKGTKKENLMKEFNL